jgi:hypothetical protein
MTKPNGIVISQILSLALGCVLFGQPTTNQPPPDPRTLHLVYKVPGAERAKVRENVGLASWLPGAACFTGRSNGGAAGGMKLDT